MNQVDLVIPFLFQRRDLMKKKIEIMPSKIPGKPILKVSFYDISNKI